MKINKIKLSYEESHKIINGQLYKLCSKCNNWLPCTEEYFYKTNSKYHKGDGLFPYCKECNKKKALKWQYNNYDHWKEIVAVRDATPEKRDRTRELAKKQKENGYYKQYQQENKDKFQKYARKRKLHKEHNITQEEWNKCKKYFNNSCAYCGILEEEAKEQQGQYLHKEHVDYNGANDLSNCVPACKSCNSQKWEFKLEEWYNKNNPNFTQERLNKINKWLNEDYKKVNK
ncbi:HNH endonuclease [Clostridium sp. MT-14]|uniref:HNH endonuclease n=1 Tax=Clostridium sp. MT-14 TaxID=3348360 RepID=UPI0035F272DB